MALFGLKHFEAFHLGIAPFGERDGELVLNAVLKGPLHGGRLQESLNRALIKHPALRARLVRQSSNKATSFEWSLAEDGQVPWRTQAVEPSRAEGVGALFAESIDLTKECGVRASLLQRSASEHLLRLDFHPALADGPAALRYFDDVMAAYAFEHGADRQVDDRAFAERHMDLGKTRHLLLLVSLVIRSLKYVFESMLTSARRQRTESQISAVEPTSSPSGPVREFQLTQEQTETLETVARRGGGSLTDVILRDLALAFKATKDRGLTQWDFDLLVERNERLGVAARDPEGQLSSLSWLHLSAYALRDRASALRSVVGRSGYLGDDILHPADITTIRKIRQLALSKLGRRARALPFPVVFADAGVPFAASFLPRDQDGAVIARGVKVESVSVVPSFWQVAGWSVGVVHYRKTLRFAVRGHPQTVSPGASAAMMDFLEERVYETASEPGRETLALDALIETHARISQGRDPLRSLAIGKHVLPDAPRLRDPRSHVLPVPDMPQVGDLPASANPESASSGRNL